MTRISLNSWWQKELCTVEKSKGKANGAHKTRSEWVFAPRCQTSSPPGCPFKKKKAERERARKIMNTADTRKNISQIPHSDPVCALTRKKHRKKNNEAIFSTVKLLSIFFFTFMFYKWMNVRIWTEKFKHCERRGKIIVSIPLEPFIVFRFFAGIYVLKDSHFSICFPRSSCCVILSWNQLFA